MTLGTISNICSYGITKEQTPNRSHCKKLTMGHTEGRGDNDQVKIDSIFILAIKYFSLIEDA